MCVATVQAYHQAVPPKACVEARNTAMVFRWETGRMKGGEPHLPSDAEAVCYAWTNEAQLEVAAGHFQPSHEHDHTPPPGCPPPLSQVVLWGASRPGNRLQLRHHNRRCSCVGAVQHLSHRRRAHLYRRQRVSVLLLLPGRECHQWWRGGLPSRYSFSNDTRAVWCKQCLLQLRCIAEGMLCMAYACANTPACTCAEPPSCPPVLLPAMISPAPVTAPRSAPLACSSSSAPTRTVSAGAAMVLCSACRHLCVHARQ